MNIGGREQKPNLPNLNSLKVELEIVHSCTGSVSLAMGYYIDNVGKYVSTTDQKICELDNSAVIIENVRSCHSRWLEVDNCDNLLEECTNYNVVCNVIDNSEKISKQSTIREYQSTIREYHKGKEIVEDNKE